MLAYSCTGWVGKDFKRDFGNHFSRPLVSLSKVIRMHFTECIYEYSPRFVMRSLDIWCFFHVADLFHYLPTCQTFCEALLFTSKGQCTLCLEKAIRFRHSVNWRQALYFTKNLILNMKWLTTISNNKQQFIIF